MAARLQGAAGGLERLPDGQSPRESPGQSHEGRWAAGGHQGRESALPLCGARPIIPRAPKLLGSWSGFTAHTLRHVFPES